MVGINYTSILLLKVQNLLCTYSIRFIRKLNRNYEELVVIIINIDDLIQFKLKAVLIKASDLRDFS